MKFDAREIENATLEAIYWWNRDEFYYNYYFSRLDVIFKNENMLKFFLNKIFGTFLREYAIRRNLSKGEDSIEQFIKELFSNRFFREVKKGNIKIIDSVSLKIKENGTATTKSTKSLLSKVAFLINPINYSLYDNYVKISLKKLLSENNCKLSSGELDTYEGFILRIEDVINEFQNSKSLQVALNVLKKFNNSEAEIYFNKNQKAFIRRVVDKYLWVRYKNIDNLKSNIKEIDNTIYYDFNNLK